MVKHNQTICRLLLTNCFSVFDHFWGLALKRLKRHENYDIGNYDSADELIKG